MYEVVCLGHSSAEFVKIAPIFADVFCFRDAILQAMREEK